MNIKDFNDINEIFKEIDKDKGTKSFVEDRFPIRFIFLPDFESMKKTYKYLTSTKDCSIIDISSMLPHEEGWITPGDIIQKLKIIINNGKNKDVVIVPLSEIIRFYSDKNLVSTFFSLCELENLSTTTQKRIYIPIVGMHERFEKTFSSNFSREWSPVWKLIPITDNKLRVIMCTDPELCKITCPISKDSYDISTTKTWLELWKRSNKKLFNEDVVCHSKTLSTLYKYSEPDSFFTFQEISTYKDVISLLHGLTIPIEYKANENKMWIQLEKIIRDKFKSPLENFESLMTSLFNIKTFEEKNLLITWLDRQEPEYRWLLKHYVLNNRTYHGLYLYIVFQNLISLDNNSFESELLTRIFKIENKTKRLLNDRKKCLNQLYNITNKTPNNVESIISHELEQVFKKNIPIREKMSLLTDISHFEKKKIFELSKIAIEEEMTREELIQLFSEIYPALYNYLRPISVDNDAPELAWIGEYFNEYRWSKILDEVSNSLSDFLNKKNSDKNAFYEWYSKIPASYSILGEEQNKESNILWIDAMGFEWANLFYHSFSKNNNVEKICIARSEIPTTTGCNRYEGIDSGNHILSLDQLIHKEHSYQYPDSFIKEIEEVKEIAEKKIDKDLRTLIISDHGFTAFVRKKHGVTKKYNFKKAEHEGRCMWTDQHFSSDSDYISISSSEVTKEQGNNVLIALRHDSLNNVSRREVHGGATPEEIIVPFFIIKQKREKKEKVYQIYPDEVTMQEGETEFTGFVITPKPHTAIFAYGEKCEWPLRFISETKKWSVNLKGLKVGKYVLSLKINNMPVAKITVNITGGMKVRDII